MPRLDDAALALLRRSIRGTAIAPGDGGYDDARRAWNLTVDQRPALIVRAADAADVVTAVRAASGAGLGVAVQATGHGLALPADDALLVLTDSLSRVVIDPPSRTATIGAGVHWGAVLGPAQDHGLTPLVGSSPGVGAVGYTLGGGIGWLGRKHGLATDRVRSFEVVTADGGLVTASAQENQDLFWGLRGGGGGSLGIVTSMVMELVAESTVYGGNLFYPAELAGEVARRYRDWTVEAPDALTSSIAFMNFPPFEAVPEPLRGRSFAIVRGCYAGPTAEGVELLRSWREWRAPALDFWTEMPFRAVATISNDPVDPIPGLTTAAWLRGLDDEVIDAVVGAAFVRGGPPPLMFAEVRHAGGAVARGGSEPAAYGNRGAAHLLQLVGAIPVPEARPALVGHTTALKQRIAPWLTGGVYLNFLEGDEKRARTRDGFSAESYARLRQLKARFDPDNVFRYGFDLS